MRTRTVSILVTIQVVLAAALFIVAWTGQAGRASLSRELTATRADLSTTKADLDSTKAALAQARADTDAANRKVETLYAACCRPGVDRATVLVAVTPAAQTSTRAPTSAPPTTRPSPAATPSPRSSTSPSPRPSPTPTCRPLPILGCRR